MEDSTKDRVTGLRGKAPEEKEAAEASLSESRPVSHHDGLLPISVVGGLVGMLLGTLPAAIWVFLFGKSFWPMYLFLPLLIYWGIRVFKGSLDRRGFIVTCIFSAIGFYLTLLSCQAALDIMKFKMLFLNLPLVTITLIGKSRALTGSVFTSAYVYPVLFTLTGILLVYELMHRKASPAPMPEPETEAE